MRNLLVILLIGFFISCSNEDADKKNTLNKSSEKHIYKSGPLFYAVVSDLKNKISKTIRGIEIGDHKDSVFLREKGDRYIKGKSADGYKQFLGNNSIFSEYLFDKNQVLMSASIDVYVDNDSIGKNLYEDLLYYYSSHLGKGFNGMDRYYIWNAQGSKKQNFVLGIRNNPSYLSNSENFESAISSVTIDLQEIIK